MLVSDSAGAEQAELSRLLGEPVTTPYTFFWTYEKLELTLGRSQRPTPELLARAERAGIRVTPRNSGGGAVMTGSWMLSASTLVPPDHRLARLSVPRSYAEVGSAWGRALALLGLESERVDPDNLAGKRKRFQNHGLDWVCFAGLSYGELTDTRNRKLVGLAQVRKKTGVAIVSGMLLERPDWETLTYLWHGESKPGLCKQLDSLTTFGSQLLDDQQAFSKRDLVARLADEFGQLGLL